MSETLSLDSSEFDSLNSSISLNVYPLESDHDDIWETTPIEFPNSYFESDAVKSSESEEKADGRSLNWMNALWLKCYDIAYPRCILNYLDYESFKIVFRTWVQVWSSIVLCILPKTAAWLGNGSYIMQIVAFITPSGGTSIVINAIACLMSVLYALAGWLLSIIAMKITHAIRGYPSKEDIAQIIISSGDCLMDQKSPDFDICISYQIFTGRFLQTKTTVVYIFAIIVGITGTGLTQEINRFFRTGVNMSLMVIIITCCYGVFFPYFDPYIISMAVLKPMGIALALKFITSVFVFPETSSYQYYNESIKALKDLKLTSENNIRFIKSFKPSAPNFSNFSNYKKGVIATRIPISEAEVFCSTMRFEVAYSRFDLGDTGEFRAMIKHLISVASGYEFFYSLLQERKQVAGNNFGDLRRRGSCGSRISMHHSQFGDLKILSSIQDNYKKVGEYENRIRVRSLRAKLADTQSGNRVSLNDLDYISDFIRKHFLQIIEDTHAAFTGIVDWLVDANEFRTYTRLRQRSFKNHQAKQIKNNENLISLKSRLHESLKKINDPDSLELTFKEVSLREEPYLTLISQTTLLLHFSKRYAEQILAIIEFLLLIDEKRPTPVIISYFMKTTLEKAGAFLDNEYATDAITDDDFDEEHYARSPDYLPPTTQLNLFGLRFLKLCKLLYNGHFWFWIRSSILVCVSATPFFCRTTAHWYYTWRLIWVVVMTALSTSETTGQTFYVFGAKLGYTFLGCFIGGVAWYISTGNGRGNYFGFGVVTAILYLYLTYYRHFSVHLSLVPQILLSVTTALVLGTTWTNEMYNSVATFHGGWKIALIRMVSVFIGLVIGLLAPLFPKPKTSKNEVRKILSKSIQEIGNFHCSITKFGFSRFENETVHIKRRHDPIILKFRKLFLKINFISELVVALKHELPLAGKWPEEHYDKLQACTNDVIQLQYILYVIMDEFRDTLMIHVTFTRLGWSDSEFTANMFSTIHMVADSLKTRQPLPKITEATLSIKHMDSLMAQWGIQNISLNERFYESKELDEDVSVAHSFLQDLDFHKFFSHDGQVSIVALLLVHIIYKRLDEIMIIVKELVGEVYLVADTIFADEFLYRD